MFKKDILGITSILLINRFGIKMSKSSNNSLWLSTKLLSSYDYFYFWGKNEIKSIIKYIGIFTNISFNLVQDIDLECEKKIRNILVQQIRE